MQRIFSDVPIPDENIIVTGADAHHLARVLRMRAGDEIVISDPSGRDHVCELTVVSGECVTAKKKETRENLAEPSYRVTLYQGMPKGEKTDVIVQKSVELGVGKVVFVVTERSVSRPDSSSLKKKTERLNRISESAAAQCGRSSVPEVQAEQDLASAIDAAASADVSLFCYEGGGEPINKILSSVPENVRNKKGFTVAVLIGPEGGFSEKEVLLAKNKGLTFCSFGSRILRTETAGSHVLSCISYEFEL